MRVSLHPHISIPWVLPVAEVAVAGGASGTQVRGRQCGKQPTAGRGRGSRLAGLAEQILAGWLLP